jgi:DNA-binding transcriptional MocR family regulator
MESYPPTITICGTTMARTDRRRHVITGSTSAAIAASVETGIRGGTLPPGTSLPTIRALADQLRVSTATVADAYRTLRQRGVVRTYGRRGTRIAELPPLATSWVPAPPTPGLRNLADGNPDPKLLPPLGRLLAKAGAEHALYGDPPKVPELVEVAREQLRSDGIDAGDIVVLGGAVDGIGRVLDAHLSPGDRVGVEDPTFPPLFHMLGSLGLVPEPMALDDSGPVPGRLDAILARGVRAVVITPRAQNPTGALIDLDRARALRTVLRKYPDILTVEDDTGGVATEDPLASISDSSRSRWAFLRSFSMLLGPDIRTAVVAGDDVTLSRVEGHQLVNRGWVSHILQRLAWLLLTDDSTRARLQEARQTYTYRRDSLVEALSAAGIVSPSTSGFNVWIPVPQEGATVSALQAAGWAVAAGEPFRLRSGPGIRVTAARLQPKDARAFADDLSAALRARVRTYSG